MARDIAGRPAAVGQDRYLDLVRQFPLRPLRSEGELDRAIARIDALSDRGELAAEEEDYLLVLAGLIERYEDEHHPMPPVTGAGMLRHLIEAKGVTQAELSAATGVAGPTISEVLSGKRALNLRHVEAFARYFHVSPAVFIPD